MEGICQDGVLQDASQSTRACKIHDKAYSESGVCIMQTHLCQLILQTDVVWKNTRENGVKLEVFQDPGFDDVSGEWMCFPDVNVSVSGNTSISALSFLFIDNNKWRPVE